MDSLIPFTTSGSLVDCVDKKMLVMLRDGRKLIGVLRSYDQFANLVLEDTVERIYHGSTFAERKVGVFLIRGENVVLLGEVDLDVEDEIPLKPVPYETLKDIYAQENEAFVEKGARGMDTETKKNYIMDKYNSVLLIVINPAE
ncbi:Sm-like ribonucleo [Pyrrhoderma noxium]|uniref:U6 snRNA-associated Sm-like protein LSm1 n=1 Tax=Pyrrhoderma noxium TaxID=2282107 RepID=A0A286US39_9AGAM|nr:Sm-like ribonucleo [Pyrrhoderma noxium]